MKALLANGSPRVKGCTYTALTELAKTLEAEGIETEMIHVGKYFTINGMPVASSRYWNMVYGGTPEEVLQDKEGLQTMRTLGRNMAFLMKSIQMGKEKMGLPEKEPAIFMNFHNHI